MLKDSFDREINYIRLSVTEHCNYRCFYCRDDKHQPNCKKEDILSYENIERIIKIFASIGVKKVRLTGGEPLLRRGIVKIARLIKNIDGIVDIPLSTNAYLLEKFADKLYENGINRVNISIDSLKEKTFKEITRGGDVNEVIKGIDGAIKSGMSPIKINMVVMRGINEDEIESMLDFAINKGIDIRFIETMPIGAAGIKTSNQYYSEKDIYQKINTHLKGKITAIKADKIAGPAKNFTIDNTKSTVGIIGAVSNHFCQSCNRIRITAKGDLILCLGQEDSLSLKNLLKTNKTDEQIKKVIINAVNKKPQKHEFNTNVDNIENRQMVEIGG